MPRRQTVRIPLPVPRRNAFSESDSQMRGRPRRGHFYEKINLTESTEYDRMKQVGVIISDDGGLDIFPEIKEEWEDDMVMLEKGYPVYRFHK